ncbi:MAG: RES family NAD+ phosphorylase [Candidatus Manganitrophus sp.]|nr:RES family NAD+ phosphorylase [Candidatus Manganitrophus sp.]
MKELFKSLEVDASIFGSDLYRARIQIDDSAIHLSEMGRPPAELARNGRANPVGIPYLYVASTPETAIAETRPHPGDLISVAKFKVTASLRLLKFTESKENDLSICNR